MPQQLVTAQDLDDWSPRLDAREHLPTLVRRLIFASVRPDQVVIPDAEGIGTPGLDGIVVTATGIPPYVPAGRSAWEFGTSHGPQVKAGEDYRKRTKQLSANERATTTIVLVTTRIWERAKVDAWIRRRQRDGWGGIEVVTAEDLATWLPQCPGVLAWLEDHVGRNPFGRTALRDWWASWANQTEPPIPQALLVAGRSDDRNDALKVLTGVPRDQVIATRTEDEAIAFLAASLLVSEADSGDDEATQSDEQREADLAAQASRLEALLERAIVVHDTNAWRSLAVHHEPLVLIPTAGCDPMIDTAVASGHHVVLPRVARPGDAGLAKLDRAEARTAWEKAGLSFDKADELARAARRSLTSLRRRQGRAGHLRRPEWSSGTSSTLLAPLLLVGSWDATFAGDERIVLEFSGRANLRSLTRDLRAIAAEPDPPLLQRGDIWEFLDPVDAWDQVGAVVTAEDLDSFHERAVEVLSYRSPSAGMSVTERFAAQIAGTLPAAEYSGAIRRGIAETLAILGAICGDVTLPGGRTGTECAARTVHALLDAATAERWLQIADLLPVLAEAAPSVLISAVEATLRKAEPPILALFNESKDALGLSSSSPHTSLLWALEALAFSPTYLSRVAVILGQLAECEPGGKLLNRPRNSIRDILHPVLPQSCADSTSRLAAIDAVRRAAPTAAWDLLRDLLSALGSGMVLSHGPRYRDWPRAPRPTHNAVMATVNAIAERLLDDTSVAVQRWADVLKFAAKVPAAVRTRMLQAAAQVWDQLPDADRRDIIAELRSEADRHTKYRDSAWALDADGLSQIVAFVEAHSTVGNEPDASLLFSYWPRIHGVDPSTEEGQQQLRAAREDAVRAAVPSGLPSLAESAKLPELIGVSLAAVTTEHDDEVLLWLLRSEKHLRSVAFGLARARQEGDATWLRNAMAAHEDLTLELLLTSDVDDSLIRDLDRLDDASQADYWLRVDPWRASPSARLAVARQLLDADRPYSALNLLHSDEGDTVPIDLGIAVMAKPLRGTAEDINVLQSPTYVLSGMLDRLEAAGATANDLAMLEWFYNPALQHERSPKALHRLLANNPSFFAQLVALTMREDLDSETEPVGTSAPPEHDLETKPIVDHWRIDDTSENRMNAFDVLGEWQLPLPGSMNNEPPTTAALKSWVDQARQDLASRRRTTVAGATIGQAISGPVADPDGTWPCEAVRDVLEHENDTELEQGVWRGRVNHRGVTSRGAYSGGQQERDLAAQYRQWADQVRGTWTRAGALLDSLADFYNADGRRVDSSADALSDQ